MPTRRWVRACRTRPRGAPARTSSPGKLTVVPLHARLSSRKLPFEKIIACNIGNPQALGQKPLSFNRQVLSLITNPEMLENSEFSKMFPEDVVARASNYRAHLKGGLGAYSGSQGVQVVRNEVAKFIEARDGVGPADADQIFLTDGASAGVRMVYTTMIDSAAGTDGILGQKANRALAPLTTQ